MGEREGQGSSKVFRNVRRVPPEVTGKGLSTQVRRPGLGLALGNARVAIAQSKVRRAPRWGRRTRLPTHRPTPPLPSAALRRQG